MFGNFRKMLFGGNRSKSAAKSRLHFVLVQDRSGLTNDEMAEFKRDMVSVIRKFFIIEDNGVEISYKRDSGETTLLINSPVLRKKINEDVAKKGSKAAAASSTPEPQTA